MNGQRAKTLGSLFLASHPDTGSDSFWDSASIERSGCSCKSWLTSCRWEQGRREFFPIGCRCKFFKIEETVAVERGVGNSYDPAQAEQGLHIDLVPAEQVRVI